MKAYEDKFIDALHRFNPRDPKLPQDLMEELSEATAHRFRVYADGYVSRVCNALAESMLERVSALYDKAFIKKILFDFVTAHPPQTALLPDCIAGFADFVAQESEHADRRDLVDLLRLSYFRWQVLNGADPDDGKRVVFEQNPPLDQIYLQTNHSILSSPAPIYSLWQAAEKKLNEDFNEEILIPNQPQTVLFYKSSALELNCLSIDAVQLDWTNRLSKGESLAEALANINFKDAEVERDFVQLLSRLQASAALEHRVGRL